MSSPQQHTNVRHRHHSPEKPMNVSTPPGSSGKRHNNRSHGHGHGHADLAHPSSDTTRGPAIGPAIVTHQKQLRQQGIHGPNTGTDGETKHQKSHVLHDVNIRVKSREHGDRVRTADTTVTATDNHTRNTHDQYGAHRNTRNQTSPSTRRVVRNKDTNEDTDRQKPGQSDKQKPEKNGKQKSGLNGKQKQGQNEHDNMVGEHGERKGSKPVVITLSKHIVDKLDAEHAGKHKESKHHEHIADRLDAGHAGRHKESQHHEKYVPQNSKHSPVRPQQVNMVNAVDTDTGIEVDTHPHREQVMHDTMLIKQHAKQHLSKLERNTDIYHGNEEHHRKLSRNTHKTNINTMGESGAIVNEQNTFNSAGSKPQVGHGYQKVALSPPSKHRQVSQHPPSKTRDTAQHSGIPDVGQSAVMIHHGDEGLSDTQFTHHEGFREDSSLDDVDFYQPEERNSGKLVNVQHHKHSDVVPLTRHHGDEGLTSYDDDVINSRSKGHNEISSPRIPRSTHAHHNQGVYGGHLRHFQDQKSDRPHEGSDVWYGQHQHPNKELPSSHNQDTLNNDQELSTLHVGNRTFCQTHDPFLEAPPRVLGGLPLDRTSLPEHVDHTPIPPTATSSKFTSSSTTPLVQQSITGRSSAHTKSVGEQTDQLPVTGHAQMKEHNHTHKPYAVKKCYMHVEQGTEKKECWITGCVVMSTGHVLVADYNNKRVKIISTERSETLARTLLPAAPKDVTLVSRDCAAVTLPEVDTVQFLTIDEHIPVLDVSRSFHVTGYCTGIDYNAGNQSLFVTYSSPPKVEILSLDGEVYRCFQTGVDGTPLFKCPQYVVAGDNALFVSDSELNAVIKLSTSDDEVDVQTTYADDRLRNPQGLVLTQDGNVLVCGQDTHTIHLLSSTCEKISVLLDRSDGIRWPHVIALCENSNTVYISSTSGDINYDNYLRMYTFSNMEALSLRLMHSI